MGVALRSTQTSTTTTTTTTTTTSQHQQTTTGNSCRRVFGYDEKIDDTLKREREQKKNK